MSWANGRRRKARRFVRRAVRLLPLLAKYVVLPLVVLVAAVAFVLPSYAVKPAPYRAMADRCRHQAFATGCANPDNQTVFITSILFDPGGQLSGGRWGARLLELIHLLGPDHVYLSIYESDSGPAGRAALQHLQRRVPCHNSIVSDERASLASLPNVTMPDGSHRTKRTALLADLRNRALRPLDRLISHPSPPDLDGSASASAFAGPPTRFDKVLFLNDIVFHPLDAAHLLFNTRGGDYLGACAIDFSHPLWLYDSFALRDAQGFAHYQVTFPFFRSDGRSLSRTDVLAYSDAVRVKSCWGGMMAVQGQYVQNRLPDPPSPDFSSISTHVIDPDRPRRVSAPVRFRFEPEPYFDACECCLFPADVAQVAERAGATETGFYVNPYIRVAYSESVLQLLPLIMRIERLLTPLFNVRALFVPSDDNPYRTVREGDRFVEETWHYTTGWRLVPRTGRSALFCGVRDMELLAGPRPTTSQASGHFWSDTRQPLGQSFFRVWHGDVLPRAWRTAYDAASPAQRTAFFDFNLWIDRSVLASNFWTGIPSSKTRLVDGGDE